MLAMGRTSHQREKRSMHVNKYVYPSQGDKGPVMSIGTCLNRSSGDGKGSTGVHVCLPTLAFDTAGRFLPTVKYLTSSEAIHISLSSV